MQKKKVSFSGYNNMVYCAVAGCYNHSNKEKYHRKD